MYLIYQNYFVTDPFNPSLTGTARYGHNGEGSFNDYAVMIAVEFCILAATLLPFSFSRFYWIRPLILQPFFGAWFLMMALAGMHAGGVHLIHMLYLLGINVIIFILLIASLIAELVGRKNQTLQNN